MGEGFHQQHKRNDEIMTGVDATGRTVLDIGCRCIGAAFHFLKCYNVKSVEGI